MSSSSSPHARHLALSALPILLRYPLSRKWVSLSSVTMLAAILKSLGLLSDFRNLLDGIDSLNNISAFPYFKFLHSSYHSFVRLLLCAFFSADELVSIGFLR
jgi:hypothetical protein